jgi:hypothetical protein
MHTTMWLLEKHCGVDVDINKLYEAVTFALQGFFLRTALQSV